MALEPRKLAVAAVALEVVIIGIGSAMILAAGGCTDRVAEGGEQLPTPLTGCVRPLATLGAFTLALGGVAALIWGSHALAAMVATTALTVVALVPFLLPLYLLHLPALAVLAAAAWQERRGLGRGVTAA